MFWSERVDRSLLWIDAHPVARGHPDAIDFCTLPVRASLLVDDQDGEHWVARDGGGHVSLRVAGGTLLSGPVMIHLHLTGFERLDPQWLALQRLFALIRRRAPVANPALPASRLRRCEQALRAFDAHEAGASFREVATVLFGEEQVRAFWRGDSDFLRLRVQRLLRDARALCARDYVRFLA